MAAGKGKFLVPLSLSFLVVGVNCMSTCQKIDDCSCKRSNGQTMSLHPIDAKPGPKYTGIKQVGKTQFTFSWNPCTKFESGSGCDNVLLCQTDTTSPGATYPAGDTVESFTEIDDGSILLTYKDVPYEGYSRKGVISLKCDPSKTPGELSGFTEQDTGSSQYSASFSSKCLCEGGCADVKPGGNGSGESGGLSTGSILLIVFFPLVFVYFMGGLLYNKYHKGAESFPEMIPNHSFWSDLPSLVKDGCVLSFQCISGCFTSLCIKIKGDSYAKI